MKFKTLGDHISLNLNAIFDCYFNGKLKQNEQILNCWRARNLTLLGKICVVKSLLLPQVLYLFSALCIKIPKSFLNI